MTQTLLEIAIECGAVLYEAEKPQVFYLTASELQATINAVNAKNCEPVYQVKDNGKWLDVGKEQYETCYGDIRIVYLAPQPLQLVNDALKEAAKRCDDISQRCLLKYQKNAEAYFEGASDIADECSRAIEDMLAAAPKYNEDE